MDSFFVSPQLQGESYLEVEPIIDSLPFLPFPAQDVIESLPIPTHDVIESLPFPSQDVQVQVQEVTESTLVLEQVQFPVLEISILENPIKNVTDDMPIALKIGKRSYVKHSISQFVYTNHLFVQNQSFIIVIDGIKTPTSI
ncbi:hypothetical protein CR513_27588, partial [Mucuna pruriens]